MHLSFRVPYFLEKPSLLSFPDGRKNAWIYSDIKACLILFLLLSYLSYFFSWGIVSICPVSILVRERWAASAYVLGPCRPEAAVLEALFPVSWTIINTAVSPALLIYNGDFLLILRSFFFFLLIVCLSCLSFHLSNHSHISFLSLSLSN